MSRFPACASVLLCCFLHPACAADSLPGRYFLNDKGELALELRLLADGSYEHVMKDGADDYSSRGSWKRAGDKVKLTPSARPAPLFRLFRDSELRITRPAEPGEWIAIVGMPKRGPLPDVEVQFESLSGKRAMARSRANGDAVVTMGQNEQWTRAALRMGPNGPWQWLDIPAARSRARIAGFAVANPLSLAPPGYEQFDLKRQGDNLIVTDGMLTGAVYKK